MKNLKNEIVLTKYELDTSHIYDDDIEEQGDSSSSFRTVEGGHSITVHNATYPAPTCSTHRLTTIEIKGGATVTREQYHRPEGCYETNPYDWVDTGRENYPNEIDNFTVEWREGKSKRHASFNILSGLLNDPNALDVDAEPYKDGASSKIADMEMVRKSMVRATQIARQTVVNDSPFAKLLQIEQK